MNSVLRLSGISKTYGSIRALKDVSFELFAGEVHALVGENGAGKSTLMKIISGACQPDEGTLYLDGKLMEFSDPLAAKRHGIAIVYQQPTLFPDLSVAENLAYGTDSVGWLRLIDWNKRWHRAKELLAQVGSDIDPSTEARELSMPQQQLVEIARAIGQGSRVLIMDEPTASLSSKEVDQLFKVIEGLKRSGVAIGYVSHRLEELQRIADRVTVLRDGTWVATESMSTVDSAKLIRYMVGRDVASIYPKRVVPIGTARLEVTGLTSAEAGITNCTIRVCAGEIVGIGGLMGAGRTELAQTLFGIHAIDSGTVCVDGSPVQIQSPADAIANGIAYVPEDRREHGVIPEMSVAENISLSLLEIARTKTCTQLESPLPLKGIVEPTGRIDRVREDEKAEGFRQQLQIKADSVFAPVSSLSGGNQQKVALGRWLATGPGILILDEPTQGIDIGAKSEIHRIIVELAEQGLAILIISSEIPELLGMCDSLAVMREGTIVDTIPRSQATPERLMSLALPGTIESVA